MSVCLQLAITFFVVGATIALAEPPPPYESGWSRYGPPPPEFRGFDGFRSHRPRYSFPSLVSIVSSRSPGYRYGSDSGYQRYPTYEYRQYDRPSRGYDKSYVSYDDKPDYSYSYKPSITYDKPTRVEVQEIFVTRPNVQSNKSPVVSQISGEKVTPSVTGASQENVPQPVARPVPASVETASPDSNSRFPGSSSGTEQREVDVTRPDIQSNPPREEDQYTSQPENGQQNKQPEEHKSNQKLEVIHTAEQPKDVQPNQQPNVPEPTKYPTIVTTNFPTPPGQQSQIRFVNYKVNNTNNTSVQPLPPISQVQHVTQPIILAFQPYPLLQQLGQQPLVSILTPSASSTLAGASVGTQPFSQSQLLVQQPVVATASRPISSVAIATTPVGAQIFDQNQLLPQLVQQPVVATASQPISSVAIATAPVGGQIFDQNQLLPQTVQQPVVQVVSRPVATPVAIAKPVVAEPFDPNPQYAYSYSVSDLTTGDQKSASETRNGDVVNGQYSLVEPDGSLRTVTYTSNAVDGFSAVVDRAPPTTVVGGLVSNVAAVAQVPLSTGSATKPAS